jgi:hypothetical protein
VNVHSVSIVGTTLLIVALYLIFAPGAKSDTLPGVFYQWVAEDGTIEHTDDPKRIPVLYRDLAVKRKFATIHESQTTRLDITDEERALQIQTRLTAARQTAARLANVPEVEEKECPGPSTITQERRSRVVNGNQLNTTFYVERDPCGNEIGAYVINPRPYIELDH